MMVLAPALGVGGYRRLNEMRAAPLSKMLTCTQESLIVMALVQYVQAWAEHGAETKKTAF